MCQVLDIAKNMETNPKEYFLLYIMYIKYIRYYIFFILLMVSFTVQKLWCSPTYLFLLLLFVLDSKIIKTYVKEFTTYIFFRNFMLSGLTFKSLIHFELMFLYGVKWSSFILLHVAVQFSQYHLFFVIN